MLDRVQDMLRACGTPANVLPPTELYNEGWMLRLVLDWFERSHTPQKAHPFTFSEQARWFSEGLLDSQFRPRYRGDPLAESWTHADGVIGHILIGNAGRGDIKLAPGAAQFVVVEAKMFSKLSPRVTHAQNYDQAARNVACMAQALYQAARPPADLGKLGFYVVAPAEQIDREPSFRQWTNKDSIREKVIGRVSAYDDSKRAWLDDWFSPTIECLDIACVAWEDVIAVIEQEDSDFGGSIRDFYRKCLDYNRISSTEQSAT